MAAVERLRPPDSEPARLDDAYDALDIFAMATISKKSEA